MFYKAVLFLITGVQLYASPLPFHFTNIDSVDKELEICFQKTTITPVKWEKSDFVPKNIQSVYVKIKEASQLSAKSRLNYIQCVNGVLLSEVEEDALMKAVDIYYETFWNDMEMYNRWFYSIDNRVPIRRLEMQYFSEFYKTKSNLYKLLELRTMENLRKEKPKHRIYNPLDEFTSIYRSLYKLHFEFYNSISEPLRNEILYGADIEER